MIHLVGKPKDDEILSNLKIASKSLVSVYILLEQLIDENELLSNDDQVYGKVEEVIFNAENALGLLKIAAPKGKE